MSVIIVLIILATIAQIIACHFSLWWLIALILRFLFCCRSLGVTFKVKKLAIWEGVVFGLRCLWCMFFHGSNPIPWVSLLINAICILFVIFLEFLDDVLYVYVTMDEEDYEE